METLKLNYVPKGTIQPGNVKEREAILISALSVFTTYGIEGVTIEFLLNEIGISRDRFMCYFFTKDMLLEAICERFREDFSGTSVLTDDVLEEIVLPETFLDKFSTLLIKRWNTAANRLFMQFMMREQPIKIGRSAITMSHFVNEARSLWWMIFDEMVKHEVIKKNDPLVLANEFIGVFYLTKMEYLADQRLDNYKAINDIIQTHVKYFWDTIKLDGVTYGDD